MSLDISIAKAEESDFRGCMVLLSQLWPDKNLNMEESRKIFMHKLTAEHHVMLVAKSANQIVGIAFYYKILDFEVQDWICMLDVLVVHEDFRGSGIGSALLDKIGEFEPKKPIWLFSSNKRKEAHQFYLKQGFVNDALFFQKNN